MLQLHWMLNYYTDMNFRLKKIRQKKKKRFGRQKEEYLNITLVFLPK